MKSWLLPTLHSLLPMLCRGFALLALICVLWVAGTQSKSKELPKCAGTFVQDDVSQPLESFVGLNKSFDEYSSHNEILKEVCPVETFYGNCFYNGITERANMLMHRHWVLDFNGENRNCIPFSPRVYLEKNRNRRIYLFGDSIMRQTWQVLVCKLFSVAKVPPADIRVNWVRFRAKRLYTDESCPLEARHCYLGHSNSVHFREYNVSIVVKNLDGYAPGKLITYFDEGEEAGPNDAFVVNFGLHANTKEDMESQVRWFLADLETMRESGDPLWTDRFYFMETVPQHFVRNDSVRNGYYQQYARMDYCEELQSGSPYHALDYRNRLLEAPLTAAEVPIIRIADALRTQHDAHVGGDTRLYAPEYADCTHYCNPGPAFDVILLQLMNALILD